MIVVFIKIYTYGVTFYSSGTPLPSVNQYAAGSLYFPVSFLIVSVLERKEAPALLAGTSDFSIDSPSPGPAGPAVGWWSFLPGSTPPVTPYHRDRSRSHASFPEESAAGRQNGN